MLALVPDAPEQRLGAFKGARRHRDDQLAGNLRDKVEGLHSSKHMSDFCAVTIWAEEKAEMLDRALQVLSCASQKCCREDHCSMCRCERYTGSAEKATGQRTSTVRLLCPPSIDFPKPAHESGLPRSCSHRVPGHTGCCNENIEQHEVGAIGLSLPPWPSRRLRPALPAQWPGLPGPCPQRRPGCSAHLSLQNQSWRWPPGLPSTPSALSQPACRGVCLCLQEP